MALYRTIQKNKGLAYDEEAFTPSTWDYLTAQSEQTWIDSSFSSMARIDELNRANGAQAQLFVGQGMGFQPLAESATEPVRMSVEAQTKRIDEAGLSSHLKAEEGFTPEALDIVIERKKEELVRQTTLDYDMPWYVDAMAFGVEFGTAMLDPINIASAFVPVIGEARALGMLTRAGKQGALALAKQRAKIGLIEGTVGAAMVEPLTYYAHDQEQADYGMYDSLVNVLSGGVFGATLQPSFGAIGDVIRKKRGGRAPWEMLSPTEESEQLRQGFIDQAYTAYIAANPNGKREEIVAAASLFDARARAHAYDVGSGETGVHDYYAKHMPRFEKGNVGEEGDLFQAMKRAEDNTFADFAERISTNPVENQKSYFEIVPEQGYFSGVSMRYPADSVRHKDKRHPDMTREDMENLPFVLQRLTMDNTKQPIKDKPRFAGKGLVGVTEVDGQHYGVILEMVTSDRAIISTYFKDSEENIVKWYNEKANKERVVETPAALWPAQVPSRQETDGNAFLNQPSSGENVASKKGDVNLYQDGIKKSHDWADPSGLSLPTNFNRRDAKNIYTDADLVKLKERNPALYQDGVSPNTQKNARYINGQKWKQWSIGSGANSPLVAHNASGNKILTEADLVKLKERNPELYQAQQQANEQDPRGAISFDADGRAVIKFFSHADASTLPHELFHVFRREMMESVQDASATPAMKERYGIIEEFVGAKSGEAWTPEMEEKFATAAERYFLEGVAPSKELKGVFAKLKQWLTEIYTSLDLNKIPISDNMRKVFGEMLVPNFTESDLLFRKQMGEMLSYDSLMARASEYDRGNELNFDVDSNQGAALDDGIAAAAEAFDRWQHVISMKDPKIAENAENLKTAILKEADDDLKHLEVRREMEIDAIACELGH